MIRSAYPRPTYLWLEPAEPALDFGHVDRTAPAPRSFTVDSCAQEAGQIRADADWLEVSPSVFTPGVTEVTVTVRPAGLRPGQVHEALIRLTASGDEAIVPITCTSAAAPPKPFVLRSAMTPGRAVRGVLTLPAYTKAGMTWQLGYGRMQHTELQQQRFLLVVGSSASAVIDVVAGEVLWHLRVPAFGGSLSQDGSRVTLFGYDTVWIWDLVRGQLIRQIDQPDLIDAVLAPAGRLIGVSYKDHVVAVRSVDSGELLWQATVFQPLCGLWSLPSGELVAMHAEANEEPHYSAWEMHTGRLLMNGLTAHALHPLQSALASFLRNLMVNGMLQCAVTAADASGTEREVLVDLAPHLPASHLLDVSASGFPMGIISIPVARTFACCLPAGDRLRFGQIIRYQGENCAALFTQDDMVVCGPSYRTTAPGENLAPGEDLAPSHESNRAPVSFPQGIFPHPERSALPLVFSANHSAWYSDGVLTVQDADGGKERKAKFTHAPLALGLDPQGDLFVALPIDEKGYLYVHRYRDRSPAVFSHLNAPGATYAIFAPHCELIATWDSGGPMLTLWETKTGARIREYGPHGAPITAAAISPDLRWLATCSEDGCYRTWEIPPREGA